VLLLLLLPLLLGLCCCHCSKLGLVSLSVTIVVPFNIMSKAI
jgi:hypothetical protein